MVGLERLVDFGIRFPEFGDDNFPVYPRNKDCKGIVERPLILRYDFRNGNELASDDPDTFNLKVRTMMRYMRVALIASTYQVLESLSGSPYLAERCPVKVEVEWYGIGYELPDFYDEETHLTLIGSLTKLTTRDSVNTVAILPSHELPGIVLYGTPVEGNLVRDIVMRSMQQIG
ncbi:MAG: hypothetical protein EPN86_03515 [Nanoarchaeota archaeon]|nr:MAG: hypothetical protein EPN86_03515 [Nanoarchaeota archaeon]